MRLRKARERAALRAALATLSARHEELEQLYEGHRALADDVMHDLRNPLTSICSNAHFLNDELTEASVDARAALRELREAGDEMRVLLDDFWVSSREIENRVSALTAVRAVRSCRGHRDDASTPCHAATPLPGGRAA